MMGRVELKRSDHDHSLWGIGTQAGRTAVILTTDPVLYTHHP